MRNSDIGVLGTEYFWTRWRRAPWLQRLPLIAVMAAPAGLLLGFGFDRRWIGDDGFINLRVVSQLLAGHGLVFNAGERVEAVTSPGWVLLLAAVGGLGFRLEDVSWTLGLGLSGLGVLLASAATLEPEWKRDPSTLRLPLGLLCYACVPAAWDYATSGLENGFGLAFLGYGYWLVARALRARSGRRCVAAGLLLGCAPLVRPDFYLLVAPLLALPCRRASGWQTRLGVLAASVAPGAAYEIFRMGYFASLVPNTALAKEAFLARWDDGRYYLWNTLGVYWLLVPMLVLLVAAVERAFSERAWLSSSFRALIGLSGLLHLAYVVRLGGDFMHARMLLPGLFAFFSALPILVIHRKRPLLRELELALAVIAYGWCLVCATHLRVPSRNDWDIGDERGWHAQQAGVRNPTRLEHYANFAFHHQAMGLKRRLEESCPADGQAAGGCARLLITDARDGVLDDHDPAAALPLARGATADGILGVVASRPLGIASAVLGLRVNVVDAYGLADPVGSRLRLEHRSRPGHEKSWDTYWLSAKYAQKGSTRDPRVRDARRALGCGVLAELQRATSAPLDWNRFWENFWNAHSFNGVRVPARTRDAAQRFCDVVSFP
jgi:arabinofuranosyltransferase